VQLTGTGRNDGEIKNYPAAGGLPFLVMEKQSGTNSTTEGGFLLPKARAKKEYGTCDRQLIGVRDGATAQMERRDRRDLVKSS
jgi:hypothetical protein